MSLFFRKKKKSLKWPCLESFYKNEIFCYMGFSYFKILMLKKFPDNLVVRTWFFHFRDSG